MALDVICKITDRQVRDKSARKLGQAFEPVILCRNCRAPVTKPEFAVHSKEGFARTFANPAGAVFEIGCFSAASGCCKGSGASGEFTWFPGYDWCMGMCCNCACQLGWIFLPAGQCPGSKFYGLILEHLIFP